jgi:hypothetical protein
MLGTETLILSTCISNCTARGVGSVCCGPLDTGTVAVYVCLTVSLSLLLSLSHSLFLSLIM